MLVNILVVSQYFPPEPGATQNRLGTFAERLVRARAPGHRASASSPTIPPGVFQPGYGRRPVCRASAAAPHRAPAVGRGVPAQDDRPPSRLLRLVRRRRGGRVLAQRRHDVCFASSPPLPGVLAVAERRGCAASRSWSTCATSGPRRREALGELSNHRVLARFRARGAPPLPTGAPRHDARPARSARTSTASPEHAKSVHLPNGALDELVALPDSDPPAGGEFVIGYAGNFGIAQGLGIVIDAAERAARRARALRARRRRPAEAELQATDRPAICWRPRRAARRRSRSRRSATSCAPATRCSSRCATTRCSSDFIPSKLYDAMAVGRPVLVAARGEAAALDRGVSGRRRRRARGRQRARGRRARAWLPTGGGARAWRRPARQAAAGLARSKQVDLLERVLGEAAQTTMRCSMCGIVGLAYRDGHARRPRAARRACATRWCTAAPTTRALALGRRRASGLGHRRLAIIDLSPAGRAPMANEDGTVHVTFNGEIYNHARAARRARGARPRLPLALRHRGPRPPLRGARRTTWSTTSSGCSPSRSGTSAGERLFLARDRLGIKPLYWTDDGRRFGFASEIKALLPLLPRREIDPIALVALPDVRRRAAAAHAVRRRAEARSRRAR